MKDLEYITSKFENENITAPASLSEDAVKAKLAEGTSVNDVVKVNKNKKRILKPLGALAACIAIVITTVVSGNAIHESRIDKAIAKAEKNGLVYFANYDELENFTGKRSEYFKNDGGYLYKFGGIVMSNEFSKSADMAESAADGDSVNASSYSKTYTQLDDVDEADIIKTDGEYIYFIDTSESTLVIYSAKDGKTELASKTFNDNGDLTFSEMYLDGDKLFVLGTEYKWNDKKYTSTDTTVVKEFNIADRTNIREFDEFKQSGSYFTSRMVNGNIYVVSTCFAPSKKFVPCCTDKNGDYKKLPAEDVCAFKECQVPDYAVIGAINTKNGLSKDKKVKAVMGGASEVYCTTEHIYVACTSYKSDTYATDIVKFKLGNISLMQLATGTVRGNVNDQFSFDEKDGYLRVATTAIDNMGNEINKLFVLDEDLNTVGSVGGYAKGEHIEAVKYIGDKAYVITYETTDPLFIIDLSNPKDPKVTGKVKIDGFSTNLVPIGEDKLMGIGYSTESTEWGEATNGVKLVLFDISDDTNPKVLDTKVYENCYSEAQSNHKAILQNREEGYLAIAITDNSDEVFYEDEEGVEDEEKYTEQPTQNHGLVFTEKGGKIKILKDYKTYESIDRMVYIGKYIYAVDMTSDTITSFELK